ncbi:MAG: DUF4339 domain-containing protein [Bdellovibrionaceae bacterium]|nr:DUF4339 domain-containing protein [Pseudobdellovibrionaceae bacterium]MBX3032486.1 DUF4339 domain-containing protein [Pseudobdellovibrionaceae bacterium]
MQRQFFLSKNGSHIGPYSFEEVLQKLQGKEHHWMDYVYDDAAQDWIMLMVHPLFAEKFSAGFARPEEKPVMTQPPVDLRAESRWREKEWFLLKGGNNYGPFSYLDLIQMLQQKSLFEYDYVWHQNFNAWQRLAEVKDFSAEQVRGLKESGDGDVSEIFFRRRHARATYGCSLIVHNNKAVYKGHSLEISEGGAGVMIENAHLQPGQTIYLHFQPGDGVPPFNAVCGIVSKQWVKEATQETPPVKYGVQFTSISQTVRQSIRDFTEKTRKAA